MFLATTALTEFWRTQHEVLFLGNWCLRYDQRSNWEQLNHTVMPSPWDDRERFYAAASYLNEVYESMLVCLTEYMNALHDLSYSVSYWRILIGPWLFHYLHALYDRYVHLTEAFNRYPNLETILLDPESYTTPKDSEDLVDMVSGDIYNMQICSEIISSLGYTFPTQPLQSIIDNREELGYQPPSILKDFIRRSVSKAIHSMVNVMEPIFNAKRKVGLCDIYLRKSQLYKLSWQSRFSLGPINLPNKGPYDAFNICNIKRRNFDGIPFANEFERVFVESLPQNFPKIYLEGFVPTRTKALAASSKIPSTIASSVGFKPSKPDIAHIK